MGQGKEGNKRGEGKGREKGEEGTERRRGLFALMILNDSCTCMATYGVCRPTWHFLQLNNTNVMI